MLRTKIDVKVVRTIDGTHKPEKIITTFDKRVIMYHLEAR